MPENFSPFTFHLLLLDLLASTFTESLKERL